MTPHLPGSLRLVQFMPRMVNRLRQSGLYPK